MSSNELLPLLQLASPGDIKDTRCPFYGMTRIRLGNALIDQNGNACALITSSFSPCVMEMAHQKPDFNSCEFSQGDHSRAVISRILDTYRVFPDKSRSHDNKASQEGIPARTWFKQVMGEDFP